MTGQSHLLHIQPQESKGGFQRDLNHIHSSVINIFTCYQEVGATQKSNSGWTDKQTCFVSALEYYFPSRRRREFYHYAEWNKPVREKTNPVWYHLHAICRVAKFISQKENGEWQGLGKEGEKWSLTLKAIKSFRFSRWHTFGDLFHNKVHIMLLKNG